MLIDHVTVAEPATAMPAAQEARVNGPLDLKTVAKDLVRHCSAYREPNRTRATVQIATTLSPFVALCGLMLWGMVNGFWPVLLLALPAGGLLVRLFIIQHDCGHGSFFKSRAANDRLGRLLSVLTVTPFDSWKRAHALHHASSGDLSRRGTGDIETLTVREYLALSRWGRIRYRIYRNPLFLIVLGSPFNFLVLQRLPFAMGLPWRAAWRSVTALNLALLAFYGASAALFGWLPTLAVFLPVICVASWIGGWLFYVQHQFEDTHWESAQEWDVHVAAISGSSYYVLPGWLQWFTGNVGLHHVHHLNSRIPNYRLQECIDDYALLGQVSRLTLWESFQCVGLALWDEDLRKLVGFSQLGPVGSR